MKNIRLVSKYFPKKETTYYAVFFDHNGIYGRLDWQISDHLEGVTHEKIFDLMLDQLEFDLNDEQTIAEIRKANEKDTSVKGSILKRHLEQEGFIEHEALEFKSKALERFGGE